MEEKVLFIVPAKFCSTRLNEKNYSILNDQPMVCYALQAIAGSEVSSNSYTIVSTEDPEESWKTIKPFIPERFEYKMSIMPRPYWLAEDPAQVDDVVTHALYMVTSNHMFYRTVCIIQPDCPMIKSEYIDEAIKLYRASMYTAVMAVSKCLGETTAILLTSGRVFQMSEHFRYQRSGMLFVCDSTDWRYHKSKAMIIKNDGALIYEIPWVDSLEVHTKEDLELASKLLR